MARNGVMGDDLSGFRGRDPRDSVLGNYSTAGIAVDGVPCAKIGM